jgi:hypothetical protein
MPTKSSAKDRAAEQADYRSWKAHAAALLERQGISAGVARERDWRQLYINGATPEKAVEHVQVAYYNSRPTFERMRKR